MYIPPKQIINSKYVCAVKKPNLNVVGVPTNKFVDLLWYYCIFYTYPIFIIRNLLCNLDFLATWEETKVEIKVEIRVNMEEIRDSMEEIKDSMVEIKALEEIKVLEEIRELNLEEIKEIWEIWETWLKVRQSENIQSETMIVGKAL